MRGAVLSVRLDPISTVASEEMDLSYVTDRSQMLEAPLPIKHFNC